MTKKWTRAMTTAVAVMTLGASLAFAMPHEGGREGGHKRGGFGKKFAQELNLTDAQKQQMADIKKANREQNAAFFEAAKATREQFRAAKQANDTAKLDALKATMESQHAQMKQIREAEMQKIQSILTADQKAKLQQMKAQRGSNWKREKK